MPLNIPYNNFVPLTTIYSSQTNSNNGSIKSWADAHEIATTGVHGVGAGTIVGTANANTFTNLNTFSNAVSLMSPNYISNARFSLTGGVLSLLNESGTAPSAASPCYFRVPNNVGASAGGYRTITFDSQTYCLIQDSTSADSYFYNGVNGTPWGTTTGIAWGNAMPLFVYVATETLGTNPCLFLARKPNLRILPAATAIGYANNPPATPSDSNVFAWTINDVTASHAGQDCYLIGYVEAIKNTNDDFTFQTLSNNCLGSYDFENRTYTMPISQNGAASGSYFYAAAGTAPQYTSNSYTYTISRDGTVISNFLFFGNTGAAGAGAVILNISIPLTPTNSIRTLCRLRNVSDTIVYCVINSSPSMGEFINIYPYNIIYASDQSATTRLISGDFYFKV